MLAISWRKKKNTRIQEKIDILEEHIYILERLNKFPIDKQEIIENESKLFKLSKELLKLKEKLK